MNDKTQWPQASSRSARTTDCAFSALSRLVIGNGLHAAVKKAFRQRPQLADGAAGFVRMEVLSPLDKPQEIWLLTFWKDQASFDQWHDAPGDGGSHVPNRTEPVRFEHVCS